MAEMLRALARLVRFDVDVGVDVDIDVNVNVDVDGDGDVYISDHYMSLYIIYVFREK